MSLALRLSSSFIIMCKFPLQPIPCLLCIGSGGGVRGGIGWGILFSTASACCFLGPVLFSRGMFGPFFLFLSLGMFLLARVMVERVGSVSLIPPNLSLSLATYSFKIQLLILFPKLGLSPLTLAPTSGG